MSGRSFREARAILKVNEYEYKALENVSLPDRGRWKVRPVRPIPGVNELTLIEVTDNANSRQFLEALRELPARTLGLPKLYDSDVTGGKIRMLVEWFPGVTLETYLEKIRLGRYQPIGPEEAIRRMHSLAFLCGVLHRDCRIIHADLKPSNLILPHERIPIAIIDFGSSWQIEKTRYRQEGDGHDRYFAAPEIFAGDAVVDARIDQFSIGMILYKMLTGKVAYDGLGGQAGVGVDDISEMESILIPPSRVSSTMRRLPPEIATAVDELVIKSLRLKPADRFSTMHSFTNQLKTIHLAMERKQIPPSEAIKAKGKESKKKPWYWAFLPSKP
ncbi:MAG: hypothetical protein J0M26_06400 [Planctomycetes bacterium]|nr:hypothetical protein [Planctomycetota bacterium]